MANSFKWTRGFDHKYVLRRIGKARTVHDGKCSFNSAEYEYWLPILISSIRAEPNAKRLTQRAAERALSDGALDLRDPDKFLVRCDRALADLLRRPSSDYVMLATVTYAGPRPFHRISYQDAEIIWQPSRAGPFLRRATKATEAQAFYKSAEGMPREKGELTPVLVRVAASDAQDAMDKASDRLDCLRGLLNLFVNSGRTPHPMARLARPHAYNAIRRGPYSSLHKPDGSLATETVWYEPRWNHSLKSVTFEPTEFAKGLRSWWKRLSKNPMKDTIQDALLQYCRALDAHDPDAALLGTWQTLERITGTDNYDELINRLTRMSAEPHLTRLITRHLRERRNKTVHAGHGIAREAEVILHQVERSAAIGIFFLLNHGQRFNNQAEVFEFLDLPLDDLKLARKQRLIDAFLEYKKQ